MRKVTRRVADRRPVVAIVYRYVYHYRARFYEMLREELDARGVDLRLVMGQPGPRDLSKRDAVDFPGVVWVRNRYLQIGDAEIVWQPVWRYVCDSDLVVLEQASRLLFNYLVMAGRLAGGPRVALWGHGRNIQGHRASRVGELVKRAYSRRVDWWFAYNERSAEAVRALGVAPCRITVVQNAVDTSGLRALRDAAGDAGLAEWRERLGIISDRVAVFTGALYEDKRLAFLLQAADLVRRRVPGFELIIVGAGPQDDLVRRAAAERPWLHVAGPLFGRDKAAVMSLARCLALPGLVGLAILDGFALGLPLVTCDVPFHSDEIHYLVDGVNGLMVRPADDPAAYAEALARVMTDDELLARLQAGCQEAAGRYTVEAMARNFAEGAVRALNTFSLRR